jgi:hypothetical protein
VARGGTDCNARTELDGNIANLGPDAPFLLQDGATLRILVPHYASDRLVGWTSTDGGTTWGPQQQLYKFANTTDAGEPILGPQPGQFTLAGFNPTSSVWAPSLDGSEAEKTERADLPGSGGYDLQVAPTPDGGLVAVGNDLRDTVFWRMAPGADPSVTANWTGPTPVGPGNDTGVAGGPGGTYALGFSPNRIEVRKWTGTAFGAPLLLDAETGYLGDIVAGPSGGVAAVWRANDDLDRLRFALSTDGGTTFDVKTIAREDVTMNSMDIAIASDNQGFAVYEGVGGGATSTIRVASTEAVEAVSVNPPMPIPYVSKSASVPGGKLELTYPGSCVPATRAFSAKLAFKRFRRSAAGRLVVLKIRRADFLIGARRVKRDTKAPFVQRIRIKTPVAGARYTLRVKAKLATRNRLRSPTKTVKATIRICS